MENTRVKALKQVQQSSWNKKNHWRPEEDLILKKYVETHGEGNWETASKRSGLNRSGKSCRLRWKNYLRPNIKRGDMSAEEEDLIIRMHKLLGNRWSLIAGRLPGRTDNEVKNYWNTHLNKNSGYPCPALESKGLSGRKRKTSTAEYTHQHQHSNLYRNKMKNNTGNMTCEDKRDGTNKENDLSSSTIRRNTTATSYLSNTEQSLNFIYADYADIDNQYPPSSSWVQYYLPTMTNNATSSSTFLFDDEPFFTSLDSILLLEAAFGCTAAAGMQSSVTMPDDPHSPHF